MNGYKTGGDWTDVTSIGRNEIVFEGRHKAYGAFYIRQRYTNALLFSLLSAIGFVGLCALVPYIFHGKEIPLPPLPKVIVDPTTTVVIKTIIPPPVHTNIKPPPPPHNTVPNNAPPAIITHVDNNSHTAQPPMPPSSPGPVTNNTGSSGPSAPAPPVPPIDNTPLKWVPEMPKFPGNVEQYIIDQTKYPEQDIQLGLQGIVYVTFVIERDGSISEVRLLKGITNGDDLNREAMRVISGMPKWTPGKQNGHPVRVEYMIPIKFRVQQ